MVQLPATAAIEYVAVCWVSAGAGGFLSGGAFVWGVFCPGDFCPGAYARSPQVQCVYEPSRLSVPRSVRTNKNTNGQTNKKKTNSAP